MHSPFADFAALPLWLYPLLLLTGLVAGFVDSIAGGGGLITLPVLLSLGMPPQVALGTNKLQATFGSGSAAWHYGRAGLIDFRACRLGIVFTLFGSTLGTLLVSRLPPDALKQTIPWLLLGIALYFLFQPKLGDTDVHGRITPDWFHFIFGLGIGFYDGFFGPGTGSFLVLAFVAAFGFSFLHASAAAKIVNWGTNLAAIAYFLPRGHVIPSLVLPMAACNLAGGLLGSRLAISRGSGFVRLLFLFVVGMLILRFAYDVLRAP